MTENMAVNGQNFGLPDLSGLSDGERQQVIAVMQRAKEFEIQEERTMKRPLEGQLNKYTNVMKGWQHRWFVLDPESGVLEYFEKEEHKKQRARASIHLAGAVICPSDEDSQTFTVNAANSEIYRLRASDAKERQRWVDRLRATAQHHTANLAQINRDTWSSPSPAPEALVKKRHSSSQDNLHQSAVTQIHRSQHKVPVQSTRTDTGVDLFTDPRGHIHEADDYTRSLAEKIEELPPSGQILNPLDKDLLLMKATSMATLQCLSQCLTILQKRRTAVECGFSSQNRPAIQPAVPPVSQVLPDTVPRLTELEGQPSSPVGSLSSASSLPYFSPDQKPPERIDHEAEVEDEVEYRDTDLEGVEEHKSIILHLLSQLKLGMDLTKVVLPTFILERRSLLELFADCMAHPNIFLRIPDLPDPESRMLAVLQWYLTSFHAGRQGSVAKKPYNPIIGETFHCSWRLSPDEVKKSEPFGEVKSEKPGQTGEERTEDVFGFEEDDLSGGDNSHTRTENTEPAVDNQQSREDNSELKEDDSKAESNNTDRPLQLTYCAEQVSHHPPISAFYFECPEKQMCMNASIYTKSKFMGMSIGLVMVGKITLRLLGHDEVYEFGLPSVYARSILTVPWVELGDKIQITCQKTKLMAAVTFHTKPFYGGKLHRVSAEVKDTVSGNVSCKVQGEWNKSFEFVFSEDDTRQIDVGDLEVYRKRVLPLDKQGEFESRRLWQHVTNTLAVGDVNTATEHKKFLEDRQREGERFRRETGTQFPTKFFHKEEEGWVYNKLLKPGQTSPSL